MTLMAIAITDPVLMGSDGGRDDDDGEQKGEQGNSKTTVTRQ